MLIISLTLHDMHRTKVITHKIFMVEWNSVKIELLGIVNCFEFKNYSGSLFHCLINKCKQFKLTIEEIVLTILNNWQNNAVLFSSWLHLNFRMRWYATNFEFKLTWFINILNKLKILLPGDFLQHMVAFWFKKWPM